MNKLNKIPLEEILSSKGRTKIVKLLALNEEINITKIAEKTGLNHNNVKTHLKYLLKIGLVQEKRYGRIRIFRYKNEYLKAKALSDFIKFWEKSNVANLY